VEAQVPNQILRDMIGTLQTLQRNGPAASGRPDALFGLQPPSISSSKPTINCTNAQNPLAILLCNDVRAAQSDWDVNAATWAYSGMLTNDDLTAFQKEQVEWVRTVSRDCKLDASLPEPQRRCVVANYQARANVLRGKLNGNALDEARLPPDVRANLQARLVANGLLSDRPDGEFGPNTRAAIRAFQQAKGAPETGFLSREEREALAGPERTRQPQFPGPLASERTAPPSSERPAQPSGPRFATEGSNEADVSLKRVGTTEPATKTVEVTGLGETAEAARKDASRLAVQQVAGVYIDNRRRVETRMSDKQVSTIVEEKLLSYTNAYVSKFEPVTQECDGGNCKVIARITVRVAPLVQTLRASDVPTVEFDSNSAAAAAATLSAERASALDTYKDLIARLENLVTVSVGQTEVNANMPSESESVWLTVPVTFLANGSATREWSEKFKRMADKRQRVALDVAKSPEASRCGIQRVSARSHPFRNDDNTTVSVPAVCFVSSVSRSSPGDDAGLGRSYPPPRSYGVHAEADCYGRTFVREEIAAIGLRNRAAAIRLTIEFLGKDGNVIQTVDNEIRRFPELPMPDSYTQQQNRTRPAFIDYCGAGTNTDRFFFGTTQDGGSDAIIVPPEGSRMNALLNVKMPNEKVGQIARIRASFKNRP